MKKFIKIVYWFLGIIVLMALISFLLPKNYKVERVVYINSSTEIVYGLTSDFQQWHLWVPWTKETDSTAIFEMTGPPAQVGTSWTWDGKILGNGEMVLTELQPGQLVAYDLAFDKGKYRSKGKLNFERSGDSLVVSWLDEGDLGYNPLSRYMGLFMDRMMGPDFEKGLEKLKLVAESRKNWPKIDETKVPAQTVICLVDSAGPAEYNIIMGKAYSELYGFLRSAKLIQNGAPFATYLKWDSVTMFSVMNICIPVDKVVPGKGRIKVIHLPEQKVVRAFYFGSYSAMEPAYRAVAAYIKETGNIETGGPSEIYITSPMLEKDTAKWETHIVFPVK